MRIPSAALLVLSSAEALGSPRTTPKAVSVPIQRRNFDPQRELSRDRARMYRRQNGVIEVTLDNSQSLYYTDVDVGAPGQALQMHLDTGSSDMWVNVPSSSLCQRNQCQGGTYSPGNSNSFKVVGDDFNISYVDGSSASGDYVTDTLQLGDVTVNDFQFGIGNTSTSALGVLGIGYPQNEAQVSRTGKTYQNLPVRLKESGAIASTVFSLWLNDLDASTGRLLFGAVDSGKYEGSLATMPIIPEGDQYAAFIVALTGITFAGTNSTSSKLPIGALLDTGATLTYMPQELAEEAYTAVNAVYSSEDEVAYVACSIANKDLFIDFDFGGKIIRVPYNEMVFNDGIARTMQNGDPACVFGIAQDNYNSVILGDTFLRSAYVVYDLENNEISVAQTVYNSTSTNIEAITSSGGKIPGATAVPNPVTNINLAGGVTGGSGGALESAAVASIMSSWKAWMIPFLASLLGAKNTL